MINAKDILAVTKSVTKKWEKQRKAEERGRRSVSSREYVYSDRVNFTEVADEILPAAYQHASGGGKYTVSKRQLYYASRQKFLDMTGRAIKAGDFSQRLLRQFINRNPGLTSSWKITADPRGTLTIANAEHDVRIPCGTIAIDEHLRVAAKTVSPLDVASQVAPEWPSLAEGKRYQAVLYIEKEGFEPVLNEAKIAERFDLAILSCKGQSVVAARKFVDHVCRRDGGVPLLVVHDFDKSGFEISQRLTSVSGWAEENDRVAYWFQNDINVHDLGLRLKDIEKYGLAEEQCDFNCRQDWNYEGFCTEDEEAFLRSGRRVELNAFTSPQLIEWLESKLTEHLPDRLVPDDDTLADAYRMAIVVAEINKAIDEATAAGKKRAVEATVPKALRQVIERAMKDSESDDSWDRTLYSLVKTKLYPDDED